MNKLLRLLLLCLCFYSALSVAHEEHNDALLLLIKYKLDIKALQQNYPLQNTDEQKQNLQQQTQLFIKAMDYLTGYVAIPESRYPDSKTYAGSLQSRAALLQDYQQLLATHLQLLQNR